MTLAFTILVLGALLGAGLALPYLRGKQARRAPWPVAALHGVLGPAGFLVLLAALWQGNVPRAVGTAGFGPVSAVLLGIAFVLGVTIAAAALRRRRPAATLVAAHASVAIAGLVVLWALLSPG